MIDPLEMHICPRGGPGSVDVLIYTTYLEKTCQNCDAKWYESTSDDAPAFANGEEVPGVPRP